MMYATKETILIASKSTDEIDNLGSVKIARSASWKSPQEEIWL